MLSNRRKRSATMVRVDTRSLGAIGAFRTLETKAELLFRLPLRSIINFCCSVLSSILLTALSMVPKGGSKSSLLVDFARATTFRSVFLPMTLLLRFSSLLLLRHTFAVVFESDLGSPDAISCVLSSGVSSTASVSATSPSSSSLGTCLTFSSCFKSRASSISRCNLICMRSFSSTSSSKRAFFS
ncbi:AAEL003693-PA [Aedes aegypti]|uniref:AAEL003693-PA n=1 Tax=Aedes aegypti TaxID=7159 RepID=Q17ET3_AEDAE|nr:AAEL003693-PA [Aedes aegypti]